MSDFDPAYHLKPPNITPDSLPVRVRDNLLREALKYLQMVENSPSTSAVLRGLIADITHVTKGNT